MESLTDDDIRARRQQFTALSSESELELPPAADGDSDSENDREFLIHRLISSHSVDTATNEWRYEITYHSRCISKRIVRLRTSILNK